MTAKIKEIFSIDARSLAVFRIGIASVLIVDLIDRVRDLAAFYTDAGVVPRGWVTDNFPLAWRFLSVHLLGGSFYFQAALFSIAFLAAFALLIGYRTRLATVISWLLVLSVFVRNPMVFYGGDSLIRALLFWGMFLPLGESWSFDAKRSRGKKEGTVGQVFSAASFALLLQTLLLYWFSSILKTGPEWQNGTALYYALSDNVHGSAIGRYLLNFPPLIQILTYGVQWFEIFGTILLLLPTPLGVLRTLGVLLFTMLQVGIVLGMNVGFLPLVSIVATLPFLPSWFWEKLSDKESYSEIKASVALNVVVGILIILVVAINLGSVAPVFRKVENTALSNFLHLEQKWGPFAPRPPLVNKWHEIPAKLEDGAEVNLYDLDVIPYTNKRWINFFELINFGKFRSYRLSYFGDYLCRLWNGEHDVKVESLKINVITQKIPFGNEKNPVRSSEILNHDCKDFVIPAR